MSEFNIEAKFIIELINFIFDNSYFIEVDNSNTFLYDTQQNLYQNGLQNKIVTLVHTIGNRRHT